ncbi:YaaC family protein [Halalkalibacterium halodurans]|uniref:YaaC-like Protein n=1 Tax=Halalkalibacterium halodurans TaxID=86665 RepID=A0A0M0KB88_ALKHA|nr:YaaC family protein [Halalkalibacterium halodurans]MED4164584.1 YaaC family protein [Halalkalibacterium halodurans]TPE66186.1 hypothetical protein AMD02_019315 [Halalkalibacterium halodurans]
MTEHRWEKLLPFFSATYTRKYLFERYEQQEIAQSSTMSYRTCYAFMYHLQHGKLFLEQGANAPYEIKPVLFFYGLIQLLKVCILTVDPEYPSSSQVLAHGVTTRKRKKNRYRFFSDEVKVQRHGLFSHVLDKMFHMKQINGEKYRMETLLLHAPILFPVLESIYKKTLAVPCHIDEATLRIPTTLLDHYHMTEARFETYLNDYSVKKFTRQESSESGDFLMFKASSPLNPFKCHPFLYESKSKVWLLTDREETLHLPSIAIHYLLLYNLSMLCRYETEWWGELFHTFDGEDLPIILRLLDGYEQLIPEWISAFLLGG